MSTVKQVTDISPEEWNTLLGNNYTLLVGSGVSMAYPAQLPMGKVVSETLIKMLFSPIHSLLSDEQKSAMETHTRHMPFEVLLSKCNQPDEINKWLYSIYSKGKANSMHKAIAAYIRKSQTKFIVTTNYDTGIENALDELGIKCKTIILESDIKIEDFDGVIVFKIHGSAQEDYKDSIIFSEEQEAIMPNWKRTFLKSFIKNTNLLILGYSGLDFEICPELIGLEPKKIFWNFYSPQDSSSSPGLTRITNSTKNQTDLIQILEGDMTHIANSIWKSEFEVSKSKEFPTLQSLPALNEDIKKLWLARVIKAIGVGDLAVIVMNQINVGSISEHISLSQLHKYFARAYFLMGHLRYALTHHLKRHTEIIKEGRNFDAFIDCHIALANIYQDIGNLHRSSVHLNFVRRQLDSTPAIKGDLLRPRHEGRFYLAKLRHLRYYEFLSERMSKIPNRRKYYRITKKRINFFREVGAKLMQQGIDAFTQIGDYNDRAACFLFAAQLKINTQQLNSLELLNLAELEYKHVSSLVGQILTFRTRIRLTQEFTHANLISAQKFRETSIHLKLITQKAQLNALIKQFEDRLAI